MQAIKNLYQTYNNGRIDSIWMDPIRFNIYRNVLELKGPCWISNLFDSQWNFLSREHIQAFFHIAINFLDYENLRFLLRKRLEKYNFNKTTLIGPTLPLILNIISIRRWLSKCLQFLNNNNIFLNAIYGDS